MVILRLILVALIILASAPASAQVGSSMTYYTKDGGVSWIPWGGQVTNDSIGLTVDTELPPAAALSDTMSNPTAPLVGSLGAVWDGSQGVRSRAASQAADTTVGIPAGALYAVFDDASTQSITENKFGPVRMSSRKALLIEGVSGGTTIPVTEASAATIAGYLDGVEGYIDGLEGTLTTASTNLALISSQQIIPHSVAFTGSGTGTTLWDPAAGKKFVLTSITGSFTAATTIRIYDSTDDSTHLVWQQAGAQYGGFVLPLRPAYISQTADNILKFDATAAGGTLIAWGYEQ